MHTHNTVYRVEDVLVHVIFTSFEGSSFIRQALEILDSKDVKRNSAINEASAIARDNISWDLSTCYLAMAQILQDSGFGDHSSRDDLEKEVSSVDFWHLYFIIYS